MFNYFIYLTSIIASLSTYHQVFLLYSHKNAENISIINIGCVFSNMCSHFIYSLIIKNTALTLTFANSVVAVGIFLSTAVYYKKYIEYRKSEFLYATEISSTI